MRQDLGWAAQWTVVDTPSLLDQLEQGQMPAGMFLSHPKADALDKQGLIFDRHAIAKTDVLLIGPADDVAGIRSERDAGRAISQVMAAAAAGQANWEAPVAGSPLAALADKLVHAAGASTGIAMGKPLPAATGKPVYRLMTRAQWLKSPPRVNGKAAGKADRVKIWVPDDPRMVLHAEVACSFRMRHEGAKLLVKWLQWPLAQGAIKASQPAWQRIKD